MAAALANLSLRCEPIAVSKEAVLNNLAAWAPEAAFTTGRLLYYPYTYCHFHTVVRTLFGGRVEGNVHVAVELVTGRESTLSAPPVVSEQELPARDRIPAQIAHDDARNIAERFVAMLVTHRIKLLRAPQVTCVTGYDFFRPFIVAVGKTESTDFNVLVDLVTGQFHPLVP